MINTNIKAYVGLVSKETSGKLWPRGWMWETPDLVNKFVFLCFDCSIGVFKGFGNPTDLELKQIRDEVKKKIDVIEPLTIPARFKEVLSSEEIDWTYRLLPDAIIICDWCGKTVI